MKTTAARQRINPGKNKLRKKFATHVCDENFRVQRTLSDAQALQELYTQSIGIVVLEIAAVVVVSIATRRVIKAANEHERKKVGRKFGKIKKKSFFRQEEKSRSLRGKLRLIRMPQVGRNIIRKGGERQKSEMNNFPYKRNN
jgi:hypothetical protein